MLKVKTILSLTLSILTVVISGCSVSSENPAPLQPSPPDQKILDQELQGQIEGRDWKIQSGHLIESQGGNGEMRLKIELYAEPINLCSNMAWGQSKTPVLIATVTDLQKSYSGYEPSLNVVGKSWTDNSTLLPSQVKLELHGLEQGYLVGGLAVIMDGSVNLNGYFAIQDCRN